MSKLENRDYVLVLDKSGSMETRDTKSGQSRWYEAKESAIAIANKISEYDKDGITVIPFASNFKVYEGTTAAKVEDVFKENSPMGGTTLAPVLRYAFEDYLKRKKAGNVKPNGELLIVVTDGQPNDEREVQAEIVKFTKQLDNGDDEYAISFLQVGKDAEASKFLKRLDDELTNQGAKYDIVDTKTMEELENIGLTEALMAALDD
jgi:Mg-chelatase subunit ChlD